MRFMLGLLVLVAACTSEQKVPRPQMESAPVDSSIRVDSAQASIFRHASYGATQVASDTSVYKIHYSLPAPLPAGDNVQLRLDRDSVVGLKDQPLLTATRTAQRDSASFKVAKVFGASARWYTCRRILRGTAQVQPERCTVWKTNWPGRLPDSLWTDSSLAVVKYILVSVPPSVPYGGLIQNCAFALALDNKARMLLRQKDDPVCRKAYDGLPVTMRLAGYPVAYKTR